jgi:hypothetical protein
LVKKSQAKAFNDKVTKDAWKNKPNYYIVADKAQSSRKFCCSLNHGSRTALLIFWRGHRQHSHWSARSMAHIWRWKSRWRRRTACRHSG